MWVYAMNTVVHVASFASDVPRLCARAWSWR